jgi:hypothetical protein
MAPRAGLEPATLRLTAVPADFAQSGTESHYALGIKKLQPFGPAGVVLIDGVSYQASPQIPPQLNYLHVPAYTLGTLTMERVIQGAAGSRTYFCDHCHHEWDERDGDGKPTNPRTRLPRARGDTGEEP